MENTELGWRQGLSKFKTTYNSCTTDKALVLQKNKLCLIKNKPCLKPQKGEAHSDFLPQKPCGMECPIKVNQKASKLLDLSVVFACHRTRQGQTLRTLVI